MLERKHVHVDGVVYIGKEANNIDEQVLDVRRSQVFIDEEEIKRKILALTPKEAREIGIKYRSTLINIKDRIEAGIEINFNTTEMRKIVSAFT